MGNWIRRRSVRLGGRVAFLMVVPLAVAAPGWMAAPMLVVPEHGQRRTLKADRVVVLKKERVLLLLHEGKTVRRYPIAVGSNPTGHKEREGDGRTPEGTYRLDWRHATPRVGPAIHVSYPDARDRRRAKAVGVDPGGGIMLHSLDHTLPWGSVPASERTWTDGCIGLKPRDLEEMWHAVRDNTVIEIRP